MKNKTFSIDFWIYLFIFGIIIGLICCFPVWLTAPGSIDFKKTGPIGDTIGGTMGPFVAIAASILTFLAFWIQFKANEQQRNDIAVERFESKFYKMLDIHINNAKSLDVGHFKGRDVFEELYAELFFIFQIVQDNGDSIIEEQIKSLGVNTDSSLFYKEIQTNKEKKLSLFHQLAYGYFFYGIDYHISRNPESNMYKFNLDLTTRLKNIVFNLDDVMKSYADIIKEDDWKNRYIGTFEKETLFYKAPYELFKGHNAQLGIYYRNLFQIVTFISSADEEMITEDSKYEYVKLLRAQLSDFEQVVLYYNSLSLMGESWNNIKDDKSKDYRKNMGYIARFKLIHNIPFYIVYFGLKPNLKYYSEIVDWEKNNKCFFEHLLK